MACCYCDGRDGRYGFGSNPWCEELDTFEYEGKEYCIFHAPAGCPQKQDAFEFNRLVFERMELVRKQGGTCDLSGTIFPHKIAFTNFNDANPLPPFAIVGGKFHKQLEFACCFLSERVLFQKVEFGASVVVLWSDFSDSLNFQACHFDGAFAIVGGGKSPCFINSLSLDNSTLRAGGGFNEVNFASGSYTGIRTKDVFRISDCELGVSDFRFSEFNKPLIVQDSKIFKMSLQGAPIEAFRFVGCEWAKIEGRRVVADSFREGLGSPTLHVLADIYRRLKRLARDEQDELLASDWLYQEKESLRLHYRQECETVDAENVFQWWKDQLTFRILSLYKLVSEYGEGPIRAGIFLFAFVLMSLAFPSLFGWLLEGHSSTWLDYIPLATRAPQSIEGSTIPRATQVIWQILITLQATLFAFALRNKFRR